MQHRQMLYTMRVRCFDGAVREIENTGYFVDTKTLRAHLAQWDGNVGPVGEPYRYFETEHQRRHNDGACCVPSKELPLFRALWHGTQQHNHEFKKESKV